MLLLENCLPTTSQYKVFFEKLLVTQLVDKYAVCIKPAG